ncbi:MAG: BON domain-containing protein [Calditrichia bacterium]
MEKNFRKLIAGFYVCFILMAFAVPAFPQNENAPLSNQTIKTVIMHRLAQHQLLQKNNIKVTVKDSTITLEGTVQSLWQKKQIAQNAHQAEESYGLINDLELQEINISGSALSDSVINTIRGHVFYSIFDWVTVDVTNGVVTLKGWAHVPWHRSEFKELAEKVPGVTEVKNDIQLLPESGSDDLLRIRAARLIYNDPIFEPYTYNLVPSIHIIVNNGEVILEGVVNTLGDRKKAADLIYYNTDASKVVNNLVVKPQ